MYSALIACKVIQGLKNRKKSAALLKLDFQKAYDSIRWSFVDHILERMGFGSHWRLWVRNYLSTTEMSIIINDSLAKPFHMERGLKQGDPFSPFLFVFVAEVLNRLISKA